MQEFTILQKKNPSIVFLMRDLESYLPSLIMKKTESQYTKMEAYISVFVYSMSMNLWQDAEGK